MLESRSVVIRHRPNHLREDEDAEEDVTYCTIPDHEVSDDILEDCSAILSNHYGVWNNPEMMRRLLVPEGVKTILVTTVAQGERVVGYCFVSQWMHETDLVSWITQLVVIPGYRNQRRATKMLRAYVNYCTLGGNSHGRNLVGVLSPHPHTICAVLRVFGRGIEVLPSKPEWERRPFDYPHAPLRGSICRSIMQASPIGRIRDANIDVSGASAYTKLHVDTTLAIEELEKIRYSMNKQMRAPWEWLFGDLADGCEYLCILEYRPDPDYRARPR
ncbi:hypothetical protein EK21DRAFT_78419, partial [Setomelanomma holmii]